MNQFNALHGEELNEPPREWNSHPLEDHFKYKTSPTNTRPMVLAILWRLNNHTIDNGDVEVHLSEFIVGFNSESVPDPDTIPIKSIDDDEMDHILELFHSENDEYLLDFELHMIQD